MMQDKVKWSMAFAIFAVLFVAGGYAALCALLYFNQESFLFFPVRNDARLRTQFEDARFTLPVADATLEGWRIDDPSGNGATLIYFGGNAEDVLYAAGDASRLIASRTVFVNYRGYGQSTGEPGEAVMLSDALAIYDFVVQQPGVDAKKIVVMGRSLGSGVATYLAAHRPVLGVVLITPYDSMVAVAKGHYPKFPVGLLLKHRFASDELAPTIQAPALLLAAENDLIVPPRHARRLHELWKGDNQLHVLNAVGHNDIEQHPQYRGLINAFLNSVVAPLPGTAVQ